MTDTSARPPASAFKLGINTEYVQTQIGSDPRRSQENLTPPAPPVPQAPPAPPAVPTLTRHTPPPAPYPTPGGRGRGPEGTRLSATELRSDQADDSCAPVGRPRTSGRSGCGVPVTRSSSRSVVYSCRGLAEEPAARGRGRWCRQWHSSPRTPYTRAEVVPPPRRSMPKGRTSVWRAGLALLTTRTRYCNNLSRHRDHATTSMAAIASEGRFKRSENLIAQRAARRDGAMPAIARSALVLRAPKARRTRALPINTARWSPRLRPASSSVSGPPSAWSRSPRRRRARR